MTVLYVLLAIRARKNKLNTVYYLRAGSGPLHSMRRYFHVVILKETTQSERANKKFEEVGSKTHAAESKVHRTHLS